MIIYIYIYIYLLVDLSTHEEKYNYNVTGISAGIQNNSFFMKVFTDILSTTVIVNIACKE